MSVDNKVVRTRRELLRWSLAGAWSLGAVASSRADPDLLDESDPAAVTFAYRADATTVDPTKNPTFRAGQTCANCSLYAGEPGQRQGGCGVFIGKEVSARGWCNAWDKKPG